MTRAARLAFATFVLVFARGEAPDDTVNNPPPFEVISRGPDLELKFHIMTFKSVRSDDKQNELALDFDGPIDGYVFDALERAFPDWIDMAYAGYDSALIRTKMPATFLTRAEPDGFSLRIIPRGTAEQPADMAPPQLRGVPGDEQQVAAPRREAGGSLARHYYAFALAERPDDAALRRGYDFADHGDAPSFSLAGDARRANHGDSIVATDMSFALPLYGDLKIIGDATGVYARGKNVRRLDGTSAPLARDALSSALGVAYDPQDSTELTAQLLYGDPGFGGRLGADTAWSSGNAGASAAYHLADNDTAEAVADNAVRDTAQLYMAQRIAQGLWGQAELRVTRYGVRGDGDSARTAGFSANLRYATDLFGFDTGLDYNVDGEYTLAAHHYAPSLFIPLSIRTREIHTLNAFLSTDVWNDVWADLYGGYAIDRYGTRGILGGGELRYRFAPGLELSLGASYSRVPTHQGESGPETAAHLRLDYTPANGAL